MERTKCVLVQRGRRETLRGERCMHALLPPCEVERHWTIVKWAISTLISII